MLDFAFGYRQWLSLSDLPGIRWKTFISAFNASARVQQVFDAANADTKHWLIHSEYQFKPSDLPRNGTVFAYSTGSEATFLNEFFKAAGPEVQEEGLCVDITGFMRPHLMLLLRMLRDRKVTKFDVIYTDPLTYARSGSTSFSDGPIEEVRIVAGFEGSHNPLPGRRDLVIIGAGYDHRLVHAIAENKRFSKQRVMYGLPSLKPGMYQEGRLRIAQVAEALGEAVNTDLLFAPANDPFVTAQTLAQAVDEERLRMGVDTNIYLSPLGTKPQAFGFALYHVTRCDQQAVSMLFPFSWYYAQETSQGVGRISRFTIELA